VGRGLGRHLDPARLGAADDLDERAALTCATWTCPPVSSARSASRATITDSAASGIPFMPRRVEVQPSCITPCALEIRILGVLDHRDAEPPRQLQRAAHELGVPDRLSVIGDRDRTGGDQVLDLGQALAICPTVTAAMGWTLANPTPWRAGPRTRSAAGRRAAAPCWACRPPW